MDFPVRARRHAHAVTCYHLAQIPHILARILSMRSSRMNFMRLVWPITARVHCHANEALSVVKVG